MAQPIGYIDAKVRIVCAVYKIMTFIKASIEFKNDQTNVVKRTKMSTMISECNDICRSVEDDIQIMVTTKVNVLYLLTFCIKNAVRHCLIL